MDAESLKRKYWELAYWAATDCDKLEWPEYANLSNQAAIVLRAIEKAIELDRENRERSMDGT